MKTAVAITGAGWDPVTEATARKRGFFIPERTPELFWPLGDTGYTVLSRLVVQFKELGAEQIFVGVGEPGCSPTVTEDNNREVYGVEIDNYGQSPWTDDQVVYIAELGCVPILIPDPHAKGENCWSTLLRMAPIMLAEDWDRIVVSAGDYVFRTGFLQHLLESAKWPSQFWFWTKHSIEFLDRAGFTTFTDFLQGLPDRRQSRVWLKRELSGLSQTVWGKHEDVLDWMIRDWVEVGPHAWGAALELAVEDFA